MGLKNIKKRTISDTGDQSPPKKQKQQIAKAAAPAVAAPVLNKTELNGDGAAKLPLNASQRKREKSKNRKLAAIARIKEAGGTPKPLWAGKKDKQKAAVKEEGESNDKNGGESVSSNNKKKFDNKGKKNQNLEDKLKAKHEKLKEIKLMNRQKKRQEDGQYKPEQLNLSEDEIRLRITEIKGRGELTKTAKRKLGVLIKKLAILEGKVVDDTGDRNNGNGNGNEEKGNLSEATKRRLRREKKGINGEDKEEGDSDDPMEEKPVNIQVFEKKIKPKVIAKKNEQVVIQSKIDEAKMKGKNKNKINPSININGNKIVKKETLKQEVDDDDEEEEEEEEDESEDEVTELDNVEEENSDDIEEDDDDDDDDEEEEDDDDDEEEESNALEQEEQDKDEESEKVEIVQKPVMKEGGKGKKQKEQKQEQGQGQGQGQGIKRKFDQDPNSEKKKRYILFVGNIPFE